MSASWRDSAARGFDRIWYGGNRLYWLLWPVAVIVGRLTILRRWAYVRRWLKSVDVGVPVVVIGNLTVGGTGKTPLTIWLAQQLTARGFRPGIVCRGYRGTAASWPQLVDSSSDAVVVGDEAKLMAVKTGCPVAAGPDRIAAARSLLQRGRLDLILADDGLQHYRLQRSFEIAVIDGQRDLGNRLCLPAGPLREPESRLSSVDAIVINGGDSGRQRAYRASLQLVHVASLDGRVIRPLADFAGRKVHAVAAIGNPNRFFESLATAGLEVIAHPHADHARLGPADLGFADGLPVMITAKDAVKCERLRVENVWIVIAELQFVPGDAERLLAEVESRLHVPDGSE